MERDYITTEYIVVQLIILGIGIYCIYFGISGLFGYQRRTYIFPLDYGYVAGLANFGSIPLGIMAVSWFFIFTFLGESETWGLVCTGISGLIGFGGVLLGMFQPKFMMPQWYRWLEENHHDVMHLLCEDVRNMGYDAWRNRTDTQEGLEEWVTEVRQKHGLEE